MGPTYLHYEMPASQDSLGLMLVLMAALHGFVILGLSFIPPQEELRTPPALEVVLVEKNNTEAPEEADYLAQASQDGGGESDSNDRPSTPFVSQQDFDTDGVAPTPMQAAAPEPVPQSADSVLTTLFSDTEVATDNEQPEETPTVENRDEVKIDQDMEIARLSAEINAQVEKIAKRPKKKFLNARTRESAAAEYMFNWVEKVERTGNLNYPDVARRNNLTGALVLVVGIFKNGEIESITIDESSGHKLLDDAAIRIVKMSAPFDPLSGELAEQTDILYIIRTWEFKSSNSITSY